MASQSETPRTHQDKKENRFGAPFKNFGVCVLGERIGLPQQLEHIGLQHPRQEVHNCLYPHLQGI